MLVAICIHLFLETTWLHEALLKKFPYSEEDGIIPIFQSDGYYIWIEAIFSFGRVWIEIKGYCNFQMRSFSTLRGG